MKLSDLPRSDGIASRFWQKVQKGEGCWPWTGAVISLHRAAKGEPP